MTTAGRELARRKAKSDAELQKQRKEVEKLKSVLAVEQAKDKEASIRVHSIRKALRDVSRVRPDVCSTYVFIFRAMPFLFARTLQQQIA